MRNLSENLKVLRDWSESVESRLGQAFEVFANHATEIERVRESGKFLGEKFVGLEEKVYRARKSL